MKKNELISDPNRVLNFLLYRLSHDFRAPIATMRGIMRVAEIDKECNHAELREMQRKCLFRMDEMVQNLRFYYHNSFETIKSENVNVKELVEGLLQHHLFRDLKIKPEIRIKERTDVVAQTDKERLRIVLFNLLSNSFKNMDERKQASFVEINFGRVKTGLYLSVKDNGIGMDDFQQYRVNQLFDEGSEKLIGSGLGLVLISEVVAKLGGKISFRSKFGIGTKTSILI